jgi:hypothetical protein
MIVTVTRDMLGSVDLFVQFVLALPFALCKAFFSCVSMAGTNNVFPFPPRPSPRSETLTLRNRSKMDCCRKVTKGET